VHLNATDRVIRQNKVALMTPDAATAGHLAFEGALTMRTIEALHATLREAIKQYSSVSIDCTAATEVDLSFVQLLVAARASAGHADKSVVLATRPDGALLDTLTRVGFRIVPEDQRGHQPGQAPITDSQTFWFEGATL
jgi:ABC-type transporter Mla MlaB component